MTLIVDYIEKLVKKANFETLLGEHVDEPQGKPTLVHESDKRPVFSKLSTAQEDFKDEAAPENRDIY